ncbi:MAG TPA: HAMP domain-containing protein, partial [Acidobacteria bacterium]|nr:HAMP domain-containing protein [Acidobacteriota bacterium]
MSPMRNLFFKIFLWFWAGILLVGVAGVLTSMWAANHGYELSWRQRLGSTVRLSIRSLEATVERGGLGKLPAAAERLGKEEGIEVWVFTSDGRELAHPGSPPPTAVRRMAEGRRLGHRRDMGRRMRGPRFARWQGRLLMAHPLRMEGGQPLTVVLALPPRPPLARLVGTRTLVVRLLAVLLIATALCWALARYLTAPVRRLRQATAALASGDLEVRVGPSLGRRRDEIADLAHDFDRMAERLGEMIASRERLLRDVSHELRSPLTRLNVALELARSGEGPEVGEHLERIQREADRLNELIGRLLTLERLENGSVRLENEVDLAALVQEVAADARFEGAARRVQMAVQAEGPAVVRGDA